MVSLKTIGQRALSSSETLRASYDIARLAIQNRVSGDFVECGVFAGAQCAAMALACLEAGQHRRIHLFDSFAGIPAGGEYDLEWSHPAGTSACSLDGVKAHMREWCIPESMLVYHEGLFADTLPKADIDEIAILRLDGDLYESTKQCLEYLYPKVVRGGWVICDDFGLSGARKAVLDHIGGGFPPVYWQIA